MFGKFNDGEVSRHKYHRVPPELACSRIAGKCGEPGNIGLGRMGMRPRASLK